MASRILRPLLFVTLACPVLSACGDTADQAVDKAKDKAREVGEQATDKGKELAGELGDKAKGKAGELSDSAKGIFSQGSAEGGVEALLARGQQLAPVAVDVAKTLHGMIDGDVEIEPIVQNLDDADAQAELDAKIKDMPRVETIDGVDVGFKDVTQWDTAGRETDSAYLILWRRDNRLLGLVYRSHKRIHVDKIVAEAPRLIGLVSGAL